MTVIVLAAVLNEQVKLLPLAVFMHGKVEAELIVMNWEGRVMTIVELSGTAAGEAVNLKLTGSYCRLMTKL